MTVATGGSTAPAPARRQGCLAYLLLLGAAGWVLVVALGTQLVPWFYDNLAMDSGSGLPGSTWFLVTCGYAGLILLAVGPAAALVHRRPIKDIFLAWVVAAGFAVVLGAARLFGAVQTQPAMLADALLSLACAAVLAAARRSDRSHRTATGFQALPLALALGALVAWPALLWGALGSPWDAALGLADGLGFGLLAGQLVAGWLLRPLFAAASQQGRLSRNERTLAIFGTGTTLFVLAGAFGFRGSQLLLLIVLPPLGLSIVAIGELMLRGLAATAPPDPQRSASRGRAAMWPAAGLVAIVTAALSMFWSPTQLSLFLGPGDILTWALRAAELMVALAVVAGLLAWALRAATQDRVAGRLAPYVAGCGLAALILWAAVGLLYVEAGHPGFYGNRFFVILRDQADLQAASGIEDRDSRREYVYTTLVDHALQTQARLRSILDQRGVHYRPFYLVNGMEVNGDPLLRSYLAAQPEVDRIDDSQYLRPLPALPPANTGDAAAPAGPAWNIVAIGADKVWSQLGVTGRGITIGQSDSGVQGNHPALRAEYRGLGGHDDYNWLDPWFGTRSPTDINGHGTHTLGTALGSGGIGVAPGAQWVGCVNLGRNLGNPAWYLTCMQFMLAPYPQGGDPFRDGDPRRAADVLNNSWGCPPIEGCDERTLAPAAAALHAAGIFVVASAGNAGSACATVTDPLAVYSNVVTVGAIDRAGLLADFSSRGPVVRSSGQRTKPDIVAPGVAVLSAFPGGSYAVESGTSMAGPHVAGVVALMWSAQPKLAGDVDRTTQILIQTARPYTGTFDACAVHGGRPNDDVGYGIVDAYAAVKAALADTPTK